MPPRLSSSLPTSSIAIGALALFVSGCMLPALTCPAKGGRQWLELGSKHFILRTDYDRSSARAQLVELEQRASILSSLVLPKLLAPSGRFEVVLFEEPADYSALFPEMLDLNPDTSMLGHARANFVGFWKRAQGLGETDCLVTDRPSWDTFQHELTHRIVGFALPQAPTWLNEGLAEFYQTLEIDWEGRALTIGRPPYLASPTEWPTAKELVTADAGTFYKVARASGFYSAAWVMVDLLLRRHPKQLAAYIEAMHQGEGSIEAWRAHLGGDWDAWDRELRGYLPDLDHRGLPIAERRPLPSLTFPNPDWEKVLPDESVHLLWAQLRNWDRPEAWPKIEADLLEAARIAPESADVFFWRARYALARGQLKEAESFARAALARRPDSAVSRALLGEVLLITEEHRHGGKSRLDELGAILEPLRLSSWAPALVLISKYEGLRAQSEGAIDFARRATVADRNCSRCFDWLAFLSFRTGRLAEAVEAAQRAVALTPEQEVPTARLARLRQYRAALASAPVKPASAPSAAEPRSGSAAAPSK